MAKNNTQKKAVLAVLVVGVLIVIFMLLAVFLSVPFSRSALEKSLKDITNESDTIPAYVIYGELYIGNEKIDVSNIYNEQYNTRGLKEIFCIADGKAYFIHTGTGTWTISSIDLESKTIQDHCVFSDAREVYRSEHFGEYSERMGYYYNGQIILSDFHSVFVYDIATEEAKQYEYDQYDFPERRIYGKCVNDTLELHIIDSVRTFTLEDMASKSEAIAKIYKLKDKADWRKSSYLNGFLAHNTVEMVGGRVYFIGSVSNWQGEPYAIILEYDVDRDTWMYVTKCFVGSDIYRDCYVVPEV